MYSHVPWMSLRTADVMKTLKTFVKTGPSKMLSNEPDPFHAIITNICKRDLQNIQLAEIGTISQSLSQLHIFSSKVNYLKSQNEERPHPAKASENMPK